MRTLPLLLLSSSPKLLAAVEPVASTATMTTSGTAYVGQVLMGLLAVLLLIVALGWLLKRFGQGGLLANQHMKVVASMPLGTRERLLVVDIAGQQLLLGISAGTISTLHTFPEPVIGTNDETSSSTLNSEFALKLRDIMRGGLNTSAARKTETHD